MLSRSVFVEPFADKFHKACKMKKVAKKCHRMGVATIAMLAAAPIIGGASIAGIHVVMGKVADGGVAGAGTFAVGLTIGTFSISAGERMVVYGTALVMQAIDKDYRRTAFNNNGSVILEKQERISPMSGVHICPSTDRLPINN